MTSRCAELSSSCSAIAPPIDQPISTMRRAPRRRANPTAASTSRHSVAPSAYVPARLRGASPSLRYETTSDVMPSDVEDRHRAQALGPRRAATVHLDHPHLAVARGEQPCRARADGRADELGGERQVQLFGVVVVPAAEGRIRGDARLRADVREELALDAGRVLGQHRAELDVALGAAREQAVSARAAGCRASARA